MRYDSEQIGKIIREERKKIGLTQDELGKMLFVTGKQISNYEKGRPLPSLETLLKMADLFHCELGYLLGEKSYKDRSRLNTIICDLMGLSSKAIESICDSTHRGLTRELAERQQFISRFFESPYWGDLVDCLVEAAAASNQCETYAVSVYQKIVAHYGEDLANKAFLLFVPGGEISHTDMADIEVQKAKQEFDDAFNKIQGNEYGLKVARYELRETFELLIRNML